MRTRRTLGLIEWGTGTLGSSPIASSQMLWVELKILQRQARRKAIIQAAVDTTVLEWLRALEEQEKREQEDAAKKEAHEMM
jgi:hypothetical protein